MFIEQANSNHLTIRFTAEIFDKEMTFLDTCVHDGNELKKDSILHLRTHFKPAEIFRYTQFQAAPYKG